VRGATLFDDAKQMSEARPVGCGWRVTGMCSMAMRDDDRYVHSQGADVAAP
jgi:hypothetical protein